jgi:hypothetical protein
MFGLGHAFRTAPPVGDFCFVDLVAHVVCRGQARSGPYRAVDVDHAAADAADQMVMVVADARFEAGRGTGRLNAPDDAFANQDAQGVVHRLKRDRANLRSHRVGYAIGGDMRLGGHRPEHRQALRRDLKTVLTKKLRRLGDHHCADKNRSNSGVIQIFSEYDLAG